MHYGWVVSATFGLVALVLVAAGGPVASPQQTEPIADNDLNGRLNSLQQQLADLQTAISGMSKTSGYQSGAPQQAPSYAVVNGYAPNSDIGPRPARQLTWQPMRRMVSWQPMKKSVDYNREQVIRAIEQQLSEVLHAGEKLGISAEDVLADLRQRNNGLVLQ
ncbi:Protein NLP-40 [Aphelenchoides avenae]|nr:Protein NLP-40 [Aphelenchus avenae]KAH7730114.1 Protein NLP-40 [Aphelenchus avenae]